MVSKYYCSTILITCSRDLNSSPGRLDLGGLAFKPPQGAAPSPRLDCFTDLALAL